MKKLLGILVLGLLLSGNAYADEPRIWLKNENTIHIAHKTHFTDWHTDVERVAIAHCSSHDKYMFWVQTTRGGAPINKHYKAKIKSSYKGSWVTEIFCSKERLSYAPNDSFVPGAKIFKTNYVASSSNQSTASSSSSQSTSTSTDDKIAQAKQICKDLGFKTNTEKFADCSLKMLSMQFETKNRLALSGGGSQQQIIVRQGYDIGDAMIALSGIISDANNSRSSYGGGNCRIFQKAWGADMVCN